MKSVFYVSPNSIEVIGPVIGLRRMDDAELRGHFAARDVTACEDLFDRVEK